MHVPAIKRTKLDNKAQMGIFLGYSSSSKGYRVYNLQTNKILVSSDVEIDEEAYWDWEKEEVVHGSLKVKEEATGSSTSSQLKVEMAADNPTADSDSGTVKTKSLSEVYESCCIAAVEPSCYAEASQFKEWNAAMHDEIAMINKNKTWELTDKPQNQHVIGVKWVYKLKLNPDGSCV